MHVPPSPARLRRGTAALARALAIAGLLLGIGCGGDDAHRPGPAVGDPRAGPTAFESYRVRWSPTPDPIRVGQVFALDVAVDEPDGTPASDVELEVDAGMPAHRHGMTLTPVVTRRAPGRFVVGGMLFHMSGRWELHVDVTRPGDSERASFEVDVP